MLTRSHLQSEGRRIASAPGTVSRLILARGATSRLTVA